MEFEKQLNGLVNELESILQQAPTEEYCTDEENDMFADMQNLLESITNYLESL
jgi:hypothetical protein